jgi:hypothetical protein
MKEQPQALQESDWERLRQMLVAGGELAGQIEDAQCARGRQRQREAEQDEQAQCVMPAGRERAAKKRLNEQDECDEDRGGQRGLPGPGEE